MSEMNGRLVGRNKRKPRRRKSGLQGYTAGVRAAELELQRIKFRRYKCELCRNWHLCVLRPVAG